MAFFGGPNGSVQIGSTSYAFDNWKLTIKTTLVEVTNFTSFGFQMMVPAISSGTLTVKGPYNTGLGSATLQAPQGFGWVGTTSAAAVPTGVGWYLWNCFIATGLFFQIPAIIESIEPEVDVKGRASVSITAQSTGIFSLVMV